MSGKTIGGSSGLLAGIGGVLTAMTGVGGLPLLIGSGALALGSAPTLIQGAAEDITKVTDGPKDMGDLGMGHKDAKKRAAQLAKSQQGLSSTFTSKTGGSSGAVGSSSPKRTTLG